MNWWVNGSLDYRGQRDKKNSGNQPEFIHQSKNEQS